MIVDRSFKSTPSDSRKFSNIILPYSKIPRSAVAFGRHPTSVGDLEDFEMHKRRIDRSVIQMRAGLPSKMDLFSYELPSHPAITGHLL